VVLFTGRGPAIGYSERCRTRRGCAVNEFTGCG
jgi:hypothetical protein